MDGKLFLSTAEFLLNNCSDEAALRSAINRAYYACFLEARKIVFDNCCEKIRKKDGIKTERGIRHEPLQACLKYSSSRPVQKLGVELANLHGCRLDADYNMSFDTTSQDANDTVENAKAFLDALSNIPSTTIGKALEEYIDKLFSS